MAVPRDEYLKVALKFTDEELRLSKSFSEWLPDSIIDCHSHSNLGEHVDSISEQAMGHMLSTFPYFSIEESVRLRGLFFPGKNVRSLRFPKTFKGIDHKAANTYLLTQSDSRDGIAVFGLPHDTAYTCKVLSHERASALKMYHAYFTPPATEIYTYFPKEILREAEMLDKPIILHPPTVVTKSCGQIKKLKEDFPNLRVVIAHLGLTKVMLPELEEAYLNLASFDNVSMDTSLVPDGDVVKLALKCFGPNRIMFGSDEPLNLIRSKVYTNPKLGQRLITSYSYHWVDKSEHDEYKHLARGLTHSHWDCMKAIKYAIDSYPVCEQQKIKENVFHDNAEDFFGFKKPG